MTFSFKKKTNIALTTLMMALITGCTSPSSNVDISSDAQKEASFFTFYNQWQGVPYRFGGNDKGGIDCSAFVQIAYREAWRISLPRTTAAQSKIGENVDYSAAKYGDLVFFKTSQTSNHVGVYLGNQRFMHASTSKGVIISRLDNPYWASTFWQFRRIDNQ